MAMNSWRVSWWVLVILVIGGACSPNSNAASAPVLPSDLPSSTSIRFEDQSSISTTSPHSLAATKDGVALIFDALMARRIECGRRPKICDVATLAVPDSPIFERLTSLMEERIRAGIVASRRGSVRYRIDEVVLNNSSEATVTTCLTDDTVLISAGAIFNDSLYSALTTWTMQRSDGHWLWVNDQVMDWRTGEDLCAFEK